MESSFITNIILPLVVAAISFGMGTSLRLSHFQNVFENPKAVLVGASCQLVGLPILGMIFVSCFSLSAEMSLGMIILTCCAGGPVSNIFTYVAKGDVALSVTLTILSSLVAVFTIPIVVNFALVAFIGNEVAFTLPVLPTMAKLFTVTFVPILLGMMLKAKAPTLARRIERPIKRGAICFLLFTVVALMYKEHSQVVTGFITVGAPAYLLNLSTFLLGFFAGKLFKIKDAQKIAVTIEIGLQNTPMAIYIGATILHNPALTIPPATYSLVMLLNAGLFAVLLIKPGNLSWITKVRTSPWRI